MIRRVMEYESGYISVMLDRLAKSRRRIELERQRKAREKRDSLQAARQKKLTAQRRQGIG